MRERLFQQRGGLARPHALEQAAGLGLVSELGLAASEVEGIKTQRPESGSLRGVSLRERLGLPRRIQGRTLTR
jgi:hypothetical protein